MLGANRRNARLWTMAAVLAAMLPLAARAQSARYTLDPVHTRVMFTISHAGYSQAIGTVSGSTGTLVFDPDDWRSTRLEASVPLVRLELGDDKWNRAALASGLLDAGKYPVATFVSTDVAPIDAQHASLYGVLTLRGVKKLVKLDVTLNQIKRFPLPPFRRVAGFSATATLNRRDFGIDAWSAAVIGDEVKLRIEAEAQFAGEVAEPTVDDNDTVDPACCGPKGDTDTVPGKPDDPTP